MNRAIILGLLLAAIPLPGTATQTRHVCYDSQTRYHPVHGTVFCDSTNTADCREGYFARNIKMTWNIPSSYPLRPKETKAFRRAFIALNHTLSNSGGVTLQAVAGGTSHLNANTPEIRVHFRNGRIPSNCDTQNTGANTRGNSAASGLTCPHGIGENSNGASGFQYTRGHVKCDIYLNRSLFNNHTRNVKFIQRTIMHEAGHCLGFHHIEGSTNRDELMYYANSCLKGEPIKNCKITSKFKKDINYGYKGFLAFPANQPFTSTSTWSRLRYNWTPYQDWFDEAACTASTGHTEQLHNGTSTTNKRTMGGSGRCRPKIYALVGSTWQYVRTPATTCPLRVCEVRCT